MANIYTEHLEPVVDHLMGAVSVTYDACEEVIDPHTNERLLDAVRYLMDSAGADDGTEEAITMIGNLMTRIAACELPSEFRRPVLG